MILPAVDARLRVVVAPIEPIILDNRNALQARTLGLAVECAALKIRMASGRLVHHSVAMGNNLLQGRSRRQIRRFGRFLGVKYNPQKRWFIIA